MMMQMILSRNRCAQGRETSMTCMGDQYCGLGVSFCAKAATLVAEEIEFLGGKAILENIFARPGTSSGFI